jgi:CheY-like chemotaxis protein
MNDKKIEVLLAEDNDGYIFLMKKFFKDHYEYNLNCVSNGEDVINYLKKVGNYSDSITPNVILLDLDMPKKNGFEVLEEIKNDSTICYIPVIVVSSFLFDRDVSRIYELNASGYVPKPRKEEEFRKIIEEIRKCLLLGEIHITEKLL